jgi:hypothetical protein
LKEQLLHFNSFSLPIEYVWLDLLLGCVKVFILPAVTSRYCTDAHNVEYDKVKVKAK